MNQLYIAIIALVTALLSSFITYKIAARRYSGTVASSDAEALWQESNNMRRELRDEVKDLRERLTTAQNDILLLRKQLEDINKK